jgi:hypothetical protein
MQSFKQQVAVFLVEPLLNKNNARQKITVPLLPAAPQTSRNINETRRRIQETHMLIKNLGKKKIHQSHRMLAVIYVNCKDSFPKLFIVAHNVKLDFMLSVLLSFTTKVSCTRNKSIT